MAIIAKVSAQVQALFGEMAEDAAKECPVVLRRRKFTTATLAQTFVFGFLADPRASDEQLAQTAALLGVAVTTQALEQRFTARLAGFLEGLFRKATRRLVAARGALAPLLERSPAVLILDSSTLTLPDASRDRFPGCGGNRGGGQAAMKFQVPSPGASPRRWPTGDVRSSSPRRVARTAACRAGSAWPGAIGRSW